MVWSPLLLLVATLITIVGISGTASAVALGTPIGRILETDIIVTINGMPLRTFNIDNNTVVIVEDLADYGFEVLWDEKERVLMLWGPESKPFKPQSITRKSGTSVGRAVGNVLYTDIITLIPGEHGFEPTRSFNVGGYTAILFDSLARFGKVSWDPNQREIRLVTSRAVSAPVTADSVSPKAQHEADLELIPTNYYSVAKWHKHKNDVESLRHFLVMDCVVPASPTSALLKQSRSVAMFRWSD
jgi:hypothetical protein